MASSSSSSIEPKQEKIYKGVGIATTKMLQRRELYGNVSTWAKRKYNFREEYTKSLVSEPLIWRYGVRDTSIACALEQVDVIADTPEGEFETDLLISGDKYGSLSFHVVLDKDTQETGYGVRSIPHCVWPVDIKKKDGFAKSPGHLWTFKQDGVTTSSPIRCIKKLGSQHKYLYPLCVCKDVCLLFASFENAFTQGNKIVSSEFHPTFGVNVYGMRFQDPYVIRDPTSLRMVNLLYGIASLKDKIWDADCNSSGSRALIGTNLGAALVDVQEAAAISWVCHSESNIMSVQLDCSENIALCGLQNGAIVSADIRLRPHARLTRKNILQSHKTGKPSESCSDEDNKRREFEFRGSIYPSGTISTSWSISCLTSLKLYDQYFLASSMDGSTKLYDHRMVQRGAVLSYEGNVGLHYANRHAVDPSENFIMSGGQDGKVRLWSIKSGELLFEEICTGSMPMQYCWGKKKDNCGRVCNIYNQHSYFGEAWIGAPDGLYLIRW